MVTDEPEDSNADNGRAAAPNLVVLQCVASVGGTLIGEALGSSLPWKLLAGVLGAATGAFLTAPGTHHRRRIVAVALFLAALQALRRTPDALASRRHSGGRPVWAPASWAAVGLTAAAGFAVGSGITTARGGWPDKDKDQPPAAVLATVPDVAGEPRATALMILEDAGFSPTSTTEPSQSISAGEATRTDPPAGTPVDAGAAVALFVSSGPPPAVEEVVVPDVAGRVEAEALATLEAAGLDATKTTDEPSESIAAGAATRTEPPAGTPVDAGAAVVLFVSSGPPPAVERVVVPDVAGRAAAEALATLEAAGLGATETTESSESIAAGAATRTEPPAGTPVDRGTSLMLFVSSGPEPPNENGGVD